MRTFFIRGLYRVLDVLKEDFLENLQQFGLLEPLVEILLKDVAEKEVPGKDSADWNCKLSSALLEGSLGVIRSLVSCTPIAF